MNATQNDPLSSLLFGPERALINFKMLRGDSPEGTLGDLRAEAHSALLQVVLGTSESHKDFPEDRMAKRVSVAALASI